MNAKLEAAIAFLGERYVFHPAMSIKRIPADQQVQMHGADVTKTFQRVRERMNPINLIVTGENK